MTSSAFSTPDNVCLDREIQNDENTVNFELIWTEDNKNKCTKWIKKNNYKKICLQFPDNYLVHSTQICDELKNSSESDCKFYILADTSYGSCCVDEIAAAHVDSDSLIHFGNACQSKVSRLPVIYVFPQLPIDLDNLCLNLKQTDFQDSKLIIYFALEYEHVLVADNTKLNDQIKQNLPDNKVFHLQKLTNKEKVEENEDKICIFVGQDSQNFFNLSMTIKATKWYIYDPSEKTIKEANPLTTNFIRRRYFYIEKCKDAQTIGLVVATLTSDGYLDVVNHIKEMARGRGIRTHIISVGRINPAKLANFMEIDCFVLIGCPFNNLYTSREFYKPIVSVFEAEMALNPAWHLKLPETYVTDFKEILPSGKFYNEYKINNEIENDVSLVTGRVRNLGSKNNANSDENFISDGILMERKNHQLMELNSGAVFEDRTWRGLEPALGNTEPVKITKGLSGIPIKYSKD